jgi:decaprenyl-phosphate phosphoribosyltransferase
MSLPLPGTAAGSSEATEVEGDKILMAQYLILLRPTQWLKNLMLFFPPFLGGVLLQPGMMLKGLHPLGAFCLASSATYLLNDVLDRHNDAHHPRKKERPVASGKVSPALACTLAALLAAAAVVLAAGISQLFLYILLAYLLVSSCYSLKLKELPVVDLFCISSGFVLRLQAGGEAFQVPISDWLFLSVFLLALFLSTGKRLGEKSRLGERAGGHRKALLFYPEGFLPGAMFMTGAAVLVTYTQYVILRHGLIYTVPLCCFGLMRFIIRVQAGQGGDPTESLLKDLPLLIVALLWVTMVGAGLYWR